MDAEKQEALKALNKHLVRLGALDQEVRFHEFVGSSPKLKNIYLTELLLMLLDFPGS